MNLKRHAILATIAAAARLLSAHAVSAAEISSDSSAATPTVREEGSAQVSEAKLHAVAFGVRAGSTRVALDANRLPVRSMPIDSLTDTGWLLTPTLCAGGDGYFLKIELPVAKMHDFSSYGLGVYPLNYGYLFRRTGLFPFASVGVTGSVLTMPGQGISGVLGEVRTAVGVKVMLGKGFALSMEAGYSPFAAAVLVDQRRTKELAQAAIDGTAVDLSPGARPVRGGVGRGFDFLVGLEWL
jgi:hypothetical protein